MSRVLPGWVPYTKAEHRLRSADLMRYGVGMALLAVVPKRRLQPYPGRRRRKHWYIRQQDVDRMMEEARVQITTIALDGERHRYLVADHSECTTSIRLQ